MTSNQLAEKKLRTFYSTFFNALCNSMSEACGFSWQPVELEASGWTEEAADPVWIKLSLAGSLRGEFTLEFFRSDAAMLAARLLQRPEKGFEQEQSEALLSLINASASQLSVELAQEFGNFTVNPAEIAEKPGQPSTTESTMGDETGASVTMRIYVDPALSEALFLHSQVENAVASSTKSMEAQATGTASDQRVPINLGLVMDVELNVTLRFGKRQLSLREVLDLTTGSVVELDRQVEEPVELLLDGEVIARGEAVVIDGNYGLRVTEVTKPSVTTVSS